MQDQYKGQHLVIEKAAGSYTHHGLGIGNGRVIHYSGLANDLTTPGVIEEIELEEFSQGKNIEVRAHLRREFTLDESILRACLRLGEAQYHILHNNCEHLVSWCIDGLHKSKQSRRGKLIYSASMGARALMGVKNPVGFLAGAVAGYAYINHQGLKKVPDLSLIEDEYERIILVKKTLP